MTAQTRFPSLSRRPLLGAGAAALLDLSRARAAPGGESRAVLPAGSVDCHCHVFDPARFPLVPDRSYTPGPATLEQQDAFHAALGVGRAVLVQPSVYGTDNSCMLDALRRLGPNKARGVAVIDPAGVTDGELESLRAAGVAGVRVNLEVKGEDRAAAAVSAVSRTLARVGPLGFVVQVYADVQLVEALAGVISEAPVPVVLDHFGGVQARLGLDQPGFAALRRLVSSGKAFVKLSAPYRASREAPDYADLAPIARALIEASPGNMVWASDWPHTGGGTDRAARKPGDVEPFRSVDDARNLLLLSEWSGGGETFRRIMVDNAARLFRF